MTSSEKEISQFFLKKNVDFYRIKGYMTVILKTTKIKEGEGKYITFDQRININIKKLIKKSPFSGRWRHFTYWV